MNQMCDGTVFQSGNHQLTVIHTDLLEAESLIRCIAEKERHARAGSFEGLSPYVYFRMPYVQPCDSFQELRRLILRIRRNTGLRAHYKGIVAIEVTEWIGHEREEYFTVLLKYLYDHRSQLQAAMILQDCKPAQMQRFLAACVRYVTPRPIDIRLFTDADSLLGPIRAAVEKCGACISHAAAAMLAEAMVKPELKDARSLEYIERAAAEVVACSGDRMQITIEHVKDYLRQSGSMLAMTAGRILYGERELDHEEDVRL